MKMPGHWCYILTEQTKQSESFRKSLFHNDFCDARVGDGFLFHNGGCSSGLDFFVRDRFLFSGYLLRVDGQFETPPSSEELLEWLDGVVDRPGELARLRGGFSGLILGPKGELNFYNDHLGSFPVFYWHDEASGDVVVSTDFWLLVGVLKKHGRNVSLDVLASSQLLNFGFLIGDKTLVDGVRKLHRGHGISLDQGRLGEFKLFDYSFTENQSEVDETLDLMTETFDRALRAEYEFDRSRGFKHLSGLSGGLDSRVNVLRARDLGYGGISTLTFAPSGYHDDVIAAKIARDHQFNHIFVGLDSGEHLSLFRDNVERNYGLVTFQGASHLNYSLGLLEKSQFGLLHSGQLGDAILGTYLRRPRNEPAVRENALKTAIGSPWTTVSQFDALDEDLKGYSSFEEFQFFNRGLNGILNGNWIANSHGVPIVSPFLDLEFVNLGFSISPSQRYGHSIYFKWLKRLGRSFWQYRWEYIGKRPTGFNYKVFHSLPYRAVRKAFYAFVLGKQRTMLPLQVWLKENQHLNKALSAEVDAASGWLDDSFLTGELALEGGSASQRPFVDQAKLLTLYHAALRIESC